MPLPDIQVVPARTRADMKAFVRFPWKVYQGDRYWVPPLIGDVHKLLDRDKHPFHQHAEVEYFLARRSGEVAGRVAAFINHAHNEFHQEKTGFFGFFETLPDPRIPPYLLEAAGSWLKARGMERVRGPANFSGNEEWGLLIDGFDSSPMVMMTYNPPAYARYLEDAGFSKAKDLVAYRHVGQEIPPRLSAAGARFAHRGRFHIRPLDKKRFVEDVNRVRRVYNAAWEKNWGFVPMTEAEIDHMAKELKPVVDPNLVLFAEAGDETIGFALALPDLNQALRRANGRLFPLGLFRMLIEARRITRIRVLTLGVLPGYRRQGIEVLLYLALFRNGYARGCQEAEFSWVLEDNLAMRTALENMDASVYKTYRLYDRPL